MSAAACGFCGRNLPFFVEGALGSHRRNQNRALPLHPKNFSRGIEFCDVDEASWPNLKFGKSVTICTKSGVIIYSSRHVTPVSRRQVLLRDRFQIEDVERLIRRGDEFVKRRLVDCRSARSLERGNDAFFESATAEPIGSQRTRG